LEYRLSRGVDELRSFLFIGARNLENKYDAFNVCMSEYYNYVIVLLRPFTIFWWVRVTGWNTNSVIL
jgi:hypothetical protein